ncbi:unnamed protein product, partial [Discosporangium mesarthrocarpum]
MDGTDLSNVVVAIDLGTSRSAWAYSIQGRAEDVVLVRVPSASKVSEGGDALNAKTETAILLDEEGGFLRFGHAACKQFFEVKEEWIVTQEEATEIKEDAHCPGKRGLLFRCFKMGLEKREGHRSIKGPVAKAVGGEKLPLIVVMTAALQCFKEDILRHLSSVFPTPQRAEDIVWVLTVPAIWDDYAKNFMRQAAHKAGLVT